MDKFINFDLYLNFVGKRPFRTLYCNIRKALYIDKTVYFARNRDIKLYKSILNYKATNEKYHVPLMKYIRLARFSLSDCNWNMYLFDEICFNCKIIDRMLENRQLLKFNKYGIVYNDKVYYNDSEYQKDLVLYQLNHVFSCMN